MILTREEARAAGLNKFFPAGKTCRHGHRSERYVQSGSCVECSRLHHPITEKRRLARLRHTERMKEFLRKQHAHTS